MSEAFILVLFLDDFLLLFIVAQFFGSAKRATIFKQNVHYNFVMF